MRRRIAEVDLRPPDHMSSGSRMRRGKTKRAKAPALKEAPDWQSQLLVFCILYDLGVCDTTRLTYISLSCHKVTVTNVSSFHGTPICRETEDIGTMSIVAKTTAKINEF